MHKSKRSQEIWAIVPEFDEHAEGLFKYLQVFTACLLAFAHGANDVANAIALLSTVSLIYQTGVVESKSPVVTWMLALSGAGIVVGLATYGHLEASAYLNRGSVMKLQDGLDDNDCAGQLQLKLLAHKTKYEQSKDVYQNATENKTQKS